MVVVKSLMQFPVWVAAPSLAASFVYFSKLWFLVVNFHNCVS